MGKIISSRLAGSTLIEAITAFVIIVLVFSISSSIIVNIYKTGTGLPLLKSMTYSDYLMHLQTKNGTIGEGSVSCNGLVYEIRKQPCPFSKKIIVIEINTHLSFDTRPLAQFRYYLPEKAFINE